MMIRDLKILLFISGWIILKLIPTLSLMIGAFVIIRWILAIVSRALLCMTFIVGVRSFAFMTKIISILQSTTYFSIATTNIFWVRPNGLI